MPAARVLMVQGTASAVGKSALVTGLCRLLARRGVRVAPFKAQNMSNNAAVCSDGGEIGRAQYVQAVAAGIDPTVDMNPILLKPQSDSCQVVVNGRVWGTLCRGDAPLDRLPDLWPEVIGALDRLRERYDMVVVEGAGGAAEINLRDRDLVNMRVARHARADVLLVADIDLGGAFAALLGTWEWLQEPERALVRGFVLNRFRGDPALLEPAPALLEQRTGVPVLGVVPYLRDLRLADEDAASRTNTVAPNPLVEIAVVDLPHLANFDEFGALAAEHGVHVAYVSRPEQLRAPDLVVLPGTKATLPDLEWLHTTGLADRARWLAEHGTPLLGVCGGFQMLGERVLDPLHVESSVESARGLGLLPIETTIGTQKRLGRASGRFCADLPGAYGALSALPASGYEIHMGESAFLDVGRPLLSIDGRHEGHVSRDGVVAGTYLHGLFEASDARRALVAALAARRGFTWCEAPPAADAADRLADAIEANVDLESLGL